MTVRVHIERVVLDGVDLAPGDEPRFRAALHAELRRLVAGSARGGKTPAFVGEPRLRGPDVSFAPGRDVGGLARDVARSLFHGIGGRT